MLNREVIKEFLDKELQEIEIPDNICRNRGRFSVLILPL